MRCRRTVDEKLKEKASFIKKIKRLLYKEQDGCCCMCGEHKSELELEAHHIVGIKENPSLQLKKSNIVLVCHTCHLSLHNGQDMKEAED